MSMQCICLYMTASVSCVALPGNVFKSYLKLISVFSSRPFPQYRQLVVGGCYARTADV